MRKLYHSLIHVDCFLVYYILHSKILTYRPCPIKNEVMNYFERMLLRIQKAQKVIQSILQRIKRPHIRCLNIFDGYSSAKLIREMQ